MKNQNYKRINLALDPVTFEQIQQEAANEFMPISTYVKRLIKMNLSTDNLSKKCFNENDNSM